MALANENNTAVKKPVRPVVNTRYDMEKAALLEVVRIRWGKRHLCEVVETALDRVLKDEGLLNEAA